MKNHTAKNPWQCQTCQECFPNSVKFGDHWQAKKHDREGLLHESLTDPDWDGQCESCGASPIVPITGLCGPCTWGEAETINGNW